MRGSAGDTPRDVSLRFAQRISCTLHGENARAILRRSPEAVTGSSGLGRWFRLVILPLHAPPSVCCSPPLLPLLCHSVGRVFLFLRRLWSLLLCVFLACRLVWLSSLVRSSFRSGVQFSSTSFRPRGCCHPDWPGSHVLLIATLGPSSRGLAKQANFWYQVDPFCGLVVALSSARMPSPAVLENSISFQVLLVEAFRSMPLSLLLLFEPWPCIQPCCFTDVGSVFLATASRPCLCFLLAETSSENSA